MDVNKLKALLEDRAQKEVGNDFLKDAREIMKGKFPQMRRMKRRLALEVACMACLAMALGWLQRLLPWPSAWFTALLVLFISLFFMLELAAFRAYWFTPGDISHAESLRKFSKRLNTAANGLMLMNASFGLFNLAMVFIEANVISFLNWQTLILFLLMQAGLSAFAQRWIAHAKRARQQLRHLTNENKTVI